MAKGGWGVRYRGVGACVGGGGLAGSGLGVEHKNIH